MRKGPEPALSSPRPTRVFQAGPLGRSVLPLNLLQCSVTQKNGIFLVLEKRSIILQGNSVGFRFFASSHVTPSAGSVGILKTAG